MEYFFHNLRGGLAPLEVLPDFFGGAYPYSAVRGGVAASQGNADSQYALALSYKSGEGVEQDDEQSVHWIRLAAKQGHANAQYLLATSYALGEGVEQDYDKSAQWLQLAAKQDNAAAQSLLASYYWMGQGVEQDDEQAVDWFRLSPYELCAAGRNNVRFAPESGHSEGGR